MATADVELTFSVGVIMRELKKARARLDMNASELRLAESSVLAHRAALAAERGYVAELERAQAILEANL